MNNADTASTIDEAAAEQAQQAVGQLLRETREKARLEIAEVARALRISQRYLEALEEGRNKELPGSTYAIGFVRSYSEYLKLDGEEIVRRYKAEAQDAGFKNALVFPKPIPDSGVPGAAVLGLGVIVAAVAYGVWYWNSNVDDITVVRVEPVPEQMAAPAASQDGAAQPQGETAPAAAEPSSEPVNEATGEAQSATESAAQLNGDAPEAFDPPAADQPAEDSPAPASSATASPVTNPPVAEQAAIAAAPEKVVKPITSAAPVPAAVAPAPQQVSAPATAPAATPAPAPAPAPTSSSEDGASRITVRATANSWIQIRDEALDRLLFTRLLREGDIYEVPNRAGLSLMTGNAGALELVVDGEAIPTIGKAGEVRRNVELDPEKLKAGTAVTE